MSSDSPQADPTDPLDGILAQLDAHRDAQRREAEEQAEALAAQAEARIEREIQQVEFLLQVAVEQDDRARFLAALDPKFLQVESESVAFMRLLEAFKALRKEATADAREDAEQGFVDPMTARAKTRDAYVKDSPVARVLEQVGWADLGTCEGLAPRPPEAHKKVTLLPTEVGRAVCAQWKEFCRERGVQEENDGTSA